MYFGNQIVSKMPFFAAPGQGGTLPPIDPIDRIDQNPKWRPLWSINNRVWSIEKTSIDHNICFLLCELQALVNWVNWGTYTPPYKRISTKVWSIDPISGHSQLTTQLTTNEESTTYRGCFFPKSPKSRKSFIFNPALQTKNLSSIGQFSSLETKSAKGRCL